MTTACDVLCDILERMGADGWFLPDGDLLYAGSLPIGSSALSLLDARPAWRDGDGWFVLLPDGWEWKEEERGFVLSSIMVWSPGDEWRVSSVAIIKKISGDYPTAPEAFRAAEAWREGRADG